MLPSDALSHCQAISKKLIKKQNQSHAVPTTSSSDCACIIIIICVLPSGRSLVPGLCAFPFPISFFLTVCCTGHRQDTHGVYRPWDSPQFFPIEGCTGLRVVFYLSCHVSLGIHLSEMGLLVLPQFTITIVFYNLLRCSRLIFSSPIPQGNESYIV